MGIENWELNIGQIPTHLVCEPLLQDTSLSLGPRVGANKIANVVHNVDGRLPAQLLPRLRGIVRGFRTARITVDLDDRAAKLLRDLHHRITFPGSQRVAVA